MSPSVFVLARQCPGSFQLHMQPRGNWSIWTSNDLITHPILLILSRLPPDPWTEKTIESRHSSSDAAVIVTAEAFMDLQQYDFFGWLAQVRATS